MRPSAMSISIEHCAPQLRQKVLTVSSMGHASHGSGRLAPEKLLATRGLMNWRSRAVSSFALAHTDGPPSYKSQSLPVNCFSLSPENNYHRERG
jgi:hypothetical protein